MNINGIKIRSSCQDVKLLTKREQLEKDVPTSVTFDYYDKWARRPTLDTETDSDSAGNCNYSPRLFKRESAVKKTVFSAIPPEKYLRPESKTRRIIYRPESCCFATISEHEQIDSLRLSKSSLGFQMKPSFGVIPKDNRHRIMLEDVTNLRKKRTSITEATPLPMSSAFLNFTENTVLRGDRYMFINQLYKRLKENKSSVRYSVNGSQKLHVIKPDKSDEKSVSRAQLIDFSEIKHILSLRREKLEKERLENLKKSDLMTFTVPYRKIHKVKF